VLGLDLLYYIIAYTVIKKRKNPTTYLTLAHPFLEVCAFLNTLLELKYVLLRGISLSLFFFVLIVLLHCKHTALLCHSELLISLLDLEVVHTCPHLLCTKRNRKEVKKIKKKEMRNLTKI
jgi:hypothetical protein